MPYRHRIGPPLALLILLGALAPPAAGRSWTESRLSPESGRSPLDTIPRTGLPSSWELSQPATYQEGSPTQRTTSVRLDPVRGTVRETYRQGNVEVDEPLVADMEAYSGVVTRRTTERVWRALTKGSRSVQRTTAARGGLFRVDIPVQLPKPIRAIVGDGTPNLEVSGSETITLSGQSDWTVRKSDTERRRQSAFPSLEMKQELNVNLTGSIGDKIKVDVDQSSNVTTSLDNKVKLRYEGDEDDMIKSVELGNTNLSLAGASFRQEGLFGVKTVMKLGTVDLTTIASKQEGKSETARFSPSGEKRRVQVDDLSYIARRYYFIADSALDMDRGELKVFREDRNTANNANAKAALARLDPDAAFDSLGTELGAYYRGMWDELIPGQDYDIITPYLTSVTRLEIPVIRFRISLQPADLIAVRYIRRTDSGFPDTVGTIDPTAVDPLRGKDSDQFLLKLIKADPKDIERLPGGQDRFDPTKPLFRTLAYELRNFYSLNARDIAIETLSLSIRRRDYGAITDPDEIGGTPLIRMLGLDQRGRNGAPDPDGLVDDNFIDVDEGTLFFPDLHPFSPDTTFSAACAESVSGFLCLDDYGRNLLREQEGPYQGNPIVYYSLKQDLSTGTRFYIDAEFRSSQQGYYLGRFDILENSEQVKVDGILQKKGTDYTLDYDTGQLTFLRPPGPDQVITVDYSFAPGVGQVQRTLLGFSSSYVPSASFSASSSMIYESRGASEQNPKLGEEPARSLVGDLSSVATIRPQLMTRAANLIPGVRTNQPSTLNLQGGISMSLPNPNTQGEAYLDDMEGNKESTTLSLSRPQWMWSGVPFDALGSRLSRVPADHAGIQWYNARGVKERDLKPVLSNEEGGDNEHQVLELNVSPPPDQAGFTSSTWTGLTQNVSRLGDDFSKLRFVEIWVNDRTQNHAQTSGILHLDLGEVDEDAFWERDAGPNNKLDTEDKNGDTKLDGGRGENGEDTGLDGLFDEQETGYDPAVTPDPRGDDYAYDLDKPTVYTGINGTEGNSQGDLNGRPDTEDLNLNGALDTGNDYFEASIDLASDSLVFIDVARDYAGHPALTPSNGWRLFRIPLEGFRRQGNPNWDNIKHARLWLSGLTGNTTGNFNIQIGGVEFVGNRWLRQPVDSTFTARGATFAVSSRNNKDDAAIYVAPFEVENAPGGKATRREQSLALLYENFQPGDSAYAFRTIGDAGGGVGWTQYRELKFWMHGRAGVESDGIHLVARFGADTVSYYEYTIPVASGWRQVVIPMEVLARLKEGPAGRRDTTDYVTGAAEGIRYKVVGRPSFTRIGRVTFGLLVPPSAPPVLANGEVWIDELRLSDVRRDKGTRGNLVVQANFADVLAINAGYENQDADFFRVGGGTNRGSGLNHRAWNLSSTFNLDRVVPRSGLQVPVRFTWQKTTDVPKYRIGSDVFLDEARSETETSRSNRRSIDVGYQRTGARRGWTRYTVDALNARMQYSQSGGVTPQSADSSWSFSTSTNYDLPLGGGRGIGLTKRMRFKYLPENVSFGTNWSSTRNVNRTRFLDAGDSSVLRRDDKTRVLGLNGNVSYVPFGSVTLRGGITSTRNMLLRQNGPFGWNKGTEVAHTQRLEMTFSPRWIAYITPSLTMSGTYSEAGGPDLRIAQGDSAKDIKNIQNNATARLTTAIPLGRLASRHGRASAARDTSSRSPLLAPVRYLTSRLGDIQTTLTIDRSTSLTRVVGNPGAAFKTGFTQVLDPGLIRLPNSQLANNRRYSAGANTTLKLLPTMNADLRADHSLQFTDAAYGARRSYSLSWPDVNVRWLELQRPLGLTNELASLALNSHYFLKADESGPMGGRIERRVETATWAPLLEWQVSWKNGLRTDLRTAHSEVRDIDRGPLGSIRTRLSTNHDIKISKLFPASRGIKFPWSKKPLRLPNDLNLSLNTTIQNDRFETENAFGFVTTERDQQILNMQTGTTYNFSQSITGGFNVGFGQTKDRKVDVTQRRINVAFNAQFRF